jgi:hypothetical protein
MINGTQQNAPKCDGHHILIVGDSEIMVIKAKKDALERSRYMEIPTSAEPE